MAQDIGEQEEISSGASSRSGVAHNLEQHILKIIYTVNLGIMGGQRKDGV